MKFEFKVNEKEEEEIKKWQERIKKKFGSYGHYTYSFTPTGIGCGIKVYSSHLDKTKDFTDLNNW